MDQYIINGSKGVLNENEAEEIYREFLDRGIVLFDTAEGYGGGTSEKRLGRLMRATDSSKNVLLMTKFLPVPWRWTHKHFELALRASNNRMGISECPIYLLHRLVRYVMYKYCRKIMEL